MRTHSLLDRFIHQADNALRTLSGTHAPSTEQTRAYPASGAETQPLSEQERRNISGLMRVNHTGEVCAQALYAGQALTARLPRVRKAMEHAAKEEEEHLLWCENRLNELNASPSALNPIWYGMSFGIGAAAGAVGDPWSLGFVEETEVQVCRHLQSHLERLPEHDQRTRKILNQMYEDEARHADMAKTAGAKALPDSVKKIMSGVSKIMTLTAYRV